MVGVGDCDVSCFHELWLYPCSEDLDYLLGPIEKPAEPEGKPLGHATAILKSGKEKTTESGRREKKTQCLRLRKWLVTKAQSRVLACT